jgi:hypothetical protein
MSAVMVRPKFPKAMRIVKVSSDEGQNEVNGGEPPTAMTIVLLIVMRV